MESPRRDQTSEGVGQLLAAPFTPAQAARAGIGRAELERRQREGRIIRLVRGVYLDAQTPLSRAVRAEALALVVGRRQILVDRTAAWIHGAEPVRVRSGDPLPVDLHSTRRRLGTVIRLAAGDVVPVEGLRCTSALRTALDLSRHLPAEEALPLLDGMLRAGSLAHPDLIRASVRWTRLTGTAQVRELAAMADGRAYGAAESVLRLRWYEARLPTPTPAVVVSGHRLALGLATHRFGVVLGRFAADALTDTARAGWRVLVLDPVRVRTSDPEVVIGHLEREFHQHLLTQVG
jgi:hypothetical protein